MNKSFGSLGTVEVAELSAEDIVFYTKSMGEEYVLLEIRDCRKRLDDMGIKYNKNNHEQQTNNS